MRQNKKYYGEAHASLKKKNDKNKDIYLVEITKLVNKATKNYKNSNTFTPHWKLKRKNFNEKTILDYFYESFALTYKTTSSELKNIYKEISDFNIEDLKDLTFKEDGKNFEERLEEYWLEAESKLEQGVPENEVADFLINKYDRILTTETRYLETMIKKNKKPLNAELLIIEAGCGDLCQGGEYAFDENVDLPPFHPNCQCIWYFDETDGLDDVEDLEIEVEE